MGNGSLGILFLLFFIIGKSHGSSCCGGGNNAPLVMSKEAASMISLLTKHSAITHASDMNGNVTTRNNNFNSVINSTDLSGIFSVDQKTQISGLVTYTSKINSTALNEETSFGINKLILQVNYEFLPEHLYSSWKPRGFIFVNLNQPLSKSIFESEKKYQTDAISNPQTSSSVGVLFKKNLNFIDILTSSSISLNFPKKIKWNNQKLNVGNFFRLDNLLDIGLSMPESNFRFGLNLNYIYQSKNTMSNSDQIDESYLLSLGLNGSYEFHDFTLGLNYVDQSYLSVAKNNTLTKSIGLNISRAFY
tara:strand:+ start:996 stop:1907 length:912 start_codon:yes stop_codon:yes gene_type:complete